MTAQLLRVALLLLLVLPKQMLAALPVLDLSQSLPQSESMRLKGPWELYRCQLLTPESPLPENSLTAYSGQSWNKLSADSCGHAWSSFGHGTYRLRLKGFTPRPEGWQISLHVASSSYRLFIFPEDHPERFQEALSGRVSRDAKVMVPAYQPRILDFHSQSSDQIWVVLIQIANFQHRNGGLTQPPFLGAARSLDKELHRQVESSLVCIGLMLFMLIYTFMLYWRRSEDKASLFLSLTCLMFLLRVIPTSNLLYYYIEDPAAWVFELHFAMEYGALIGTPTAYALFAYFTFRQQSSRRLVLCLALPGLALTLFCFLGPMVLFTNALPLLQLLMAVQMLVTLRTTILAIREKAEGAWLAMAGDISLGLCVIYDVLMASNVLPRTIYITQYGACVFLFLQSQLVARRFAKAFRISERLQRELQVEVDRQTEELSSMMTNIPQGVFVILSDRSIQGQYSRYLETLLGEGQLSGKPALPTLFAGSSLSQEQKDLALSALVASLGEDILAWDLNSGNLPREFVRLTPGNQRILELDWNPIVNREACVDRVLVTVRDVTQFRTLQVESQRQKLESAMIQELLQAERETIVSFFQSSETLLTEIAELLRNRSHGSAELGRNCFLKLHTLKGLARSYGLGRLTTTIHEVEQDLVQHQKAEWALWNREDFQSSMQAVQDVAREYASLLKDKLGWAYGNPAGPVWNEKELQELEQKARPLTARNLAADPQLKILLDTLRQFLNRYLYEDLNRLLLSLQKDMNRLAAAMDKAEPRLIVEAEAISLTRPMENLLRNACLHLIRNAMDHGLEKPEDRRRVGKAEAGTIHVAAFRQGPSFHISFQDDGRGLNPDLIRNKAEQAGLIPKGEGLSLEAVANLIFHPGFSTRDEATDVSGRGMGMEAIRGLFEQAGGRFELELLSTQPDDHGYLPFRLIGTLPAQLLDQTAECLEPAAS